MMVRFFFPVFLLSLSYIHSLTDNNAIDSRVGEQDSVIRVTGHVYDSMTNEPIGGAIISFETLPYGNFIGIIYSDPIHGQYEFLTFGDDAYRIEVKASNYNKVTDLIYPLRDAGNGELSRNFFLVKDPEEGEIIKLENLIFDLGKSQINPESYDELDNLVNLMLQNTTMIIRLEGHTDHRGGQSKNLELSLDRVNEVKKFLMKKGIDPNRILTAGYGGSRPLNREASEEAAAVNRRVEVRIIRK